MQNELKILTYNIFIRPPLITTNGTDYKDARLRDFMSNYMQDYDIICFQELFSSFSSRRDWLVNEAFLQGFKHSYSIKKKFNVVSPIDGGVTIISKYPIVKRDYIIYPRGSHGDALAQKGAIFCRIQFNCRMVDVYNTHLQAICKYQDIRKKQLCLFNDFFLKTHNHNNPAVICGDFNIDFHRSAQYNELFQFLQFECSKTVNTYLEANEFDLVSRSATYGCGFDKCLTCEDDQEIHELLDYIFLVTDERSDEQLLVYDACKIECFLIENPWYPYKQLSDHYGVTATLRLVPPDHNFA